MSLITDKKSKTWKRNFIKKIFGGPAAAFEIVNNVDYFEIIIFLWNNFVLICNIFVIFSYFIFGHFALN